MALLIHHLLALYLTLTISVARAYESPLIRLDYGIFQGRYDSTYNLSYFRKIPFAAPPTGENRFRAPQPPMSILDDMYDTDQDSDMCPQRTVNVSEDCLYLGLFSRPWNVRSASTAATKRPVLVVASFKGVPPLPYRRPPIQSSMQTNAYNAPEAEAIYEHLTNLTGCANATEALACLQAVDVQTIRDANLINGEFLFDTLTEAVTSDSLQTQLVFGMYNTHGGENFVLPGFPSLNTTNGFNSSIPSFHQWLVGFLPGLSSEEIHIVESKYHPPVGRSETLDLYNFTYVRAGLIYRDVVLACPAYWIALAARTAGYAGEYTISPAQHASDIIYVCLSQSTVSVYFRYMGSRTDFTGSYFSGIKSTESNARMN
ncbi:unnamed protein product [Aspergillus oryzae]|nr:unnamed protein product [Aspergillus oryzae]